MKIKKIMFFVSLIVVFYLFCSKFDSYTGAGSTIIDDSDKSLLDFTSRFYPILFDSSKIILEEFSLPDTSGLGFGYIGDYLISGERADVYYYGISNFVFSYKDIKTRLSSTIVEDTIDSISIIYQIQSDTIIGTKIAEMSKLSLILCDTNSRYNLPEDVSSKEKKAVSTWTITEDSILVFKLIDSFLIDSIISLCRHTFNDINNDTGWRKEINISLVNNDTSLMLFNKNSYLLIYSHSYKDGKSKIDTIYSYSFSMASEKQSLIEKLKTKRVSAVPSKRTAVFKVNLSKFWDTLENYETKEILSASLIFGIDTIEELHRDSAIFAICLLSDSLYKDANSLRYQVDTVHKYHIEYVKIDPSNDSLIFFPIHKQLQFYRQKKCNTLYVYIQLFKINNRENYSVYWRKPSLKVLLTKVN